MAKELLGVLWAYRCGPQSSKKETPFSLVYGTDAMILVETKESSLRREHYNEELNNNNLNTNLDLLVKQEKKPNTESDN